MANRITSTAINQALESAFKAAGSNAYFGNGFQAGVEYATKWTDVSEQPPIGIALLLKHDCGTYQVGYFLKAKYRDLAFYSYAEPDIEFLLTTVVKWRHIDFS